MHCPHPCAGVSNVSQRSLLVRRSANGCHRLGQRRTAHFRGTRLRSSRQGRRRGSEEAELGCQSGCRSEIDFCRGANCSSASPSQSVQGLSAKLYCGSSAGPDQRPDLHHDGQPCRLRQRQQSDGARRRDHTHLAYCLQQLGLRQRRDPDAHSAPVDLRRGPGGISAVSGHGHPARRDHLRRPEPSQLCAHCGGAEHGHHGCVAGYTDREQHDVYPRKLCQPEFGLLRLQRILRYPFRQS